MCVFDDYGLANALFPVNNLYRLHRYAFTRNHGLYFFRIIKRRIVYFKRIDNSEKDDSNKKTIARIIRQITGDYDYLGRNQCFRQINREIRKYLYLLRLLRKLGNLRVTLCTCVI